MFSSFKMVVGGLKRWLYGCALLVLGVLFLVVSKISWASNASDDERLASAQTEQSVMGTRTTSAQVIKYSPEGLPQLPPLGQGIKYEEGKGLYVRDSERTAYLTFDPELQKSAEQLLQQFSVPYGALVAIEPKTGKVLALAGFSHDEPQSPNVATRAGFPTASVFKLVTASAAIEQAGLTTGDEIKFRGGDYTLSKGNYQPSDKSDSRRMSLATALGKSCNPVFGRIALTELERGTLETYAVNYGYNTEIPFEFPLQRSRFELSSDDDYQRARTGAGFGDVTISPLHAALLASAIANGGKMMRPFAVDRVESAEGKVEYTTKPSVLKQAVLPSTADEMLRAMRYTVTEGTARKQFSALKKTKYGDITVGGKTGTLSGSNPKGLYTWFVATAPLEDPKIAISALVIDPGTARVKGSELGRRFLEHYFQSTAWDE